MSTMTVSPTFEEEPSFFVGQTNLCYFHVSSSPKSTVSQCCCQRAAETQTLRVNEAAYKNHTTLNFSRETDALETILKMLLVCLFKGNKSIKASITLSNLSKDQQSIV